MCICNNVHTHVHIKMYVLRIMLPKDDPKPVLVWPNALVVAPPKPPNPAVDVPPKPVEDAPPKPPNPVVEVVGWVVELPKRPDEKVFACEVAVPPKLKADEEVAVFVVPNNEPPKLGTDEVLPNAGADDAVPNTGALFEPNAGAAVDVAPKAGAAWPKAGVVPNDVAAGCVEPNAGAAVCVPPKGAAVPNADGVFVAPNEFVAPNAGAGAKNNSTN